MKTDPAPTLDSLILDLERALLDEALAIRHAIPSDAELLTRRTAHARADTLILAHGRLREALVRVEPRFRGGDGFSESWEVTCPNGCGEILNWQRFLHGDEGRWCDEDTVAHECPRCEHDLDDEDPSEALTALVKAQNAAAREVTPA